MQRPECKENCSRTLLKILFLSTENPIFYHNLMLMRESTVNQTFENKLSFQWRIMQHRLCNLHIICLTDRTTFPQTFIITKTTASTSLVQFAIQFACQIDSLRKNASLIRFLQKSNRWPSDRKHCINTDSNFSDIF